MGYITTRPTLTMVEVVGTVSQRLLNSMTFSKVLQTRITQVMDRKNVEALWLIQAMRRQIILDLVTVCRSDKCTTARENPLKIVPRIRLYSQKNCQALWVTMNVREFVLSSTPHEMGPMWGTGSSSGMQMLT